MSNSDEYLTNLKDKSTIITGGASGIGLATARKFAAAGAYVTIADLNAEAGETVAKELTAQGCHVQFAECDTTVWKSLVAAFKKAVSFSLHQTLDVAVLSAGISNAAENRMVRDAAEAQLSLDADPEEPGKHTIDVNLIGVYWSAWLALYYFRLEGADGATRTAGEGVALQKSLVLIASAAAYIDFPGAPTMYRTSKWGLRGLFHSIKHDTKLVGARCNLINPSYVRTPLTASLESVPTPWTDISLVVDAITRCAGDTDTDGTYVRDSSSGRHR